jgi:hypothetical protein
MFLYWFAVFNFIDIYCNFIIYFLLLTLHLICSSFSSFLRWKLRLLILGLWFFFWWWYWIWIQGLALARQAVYHLNHVFLALCQRRFYVYILADLDHNPPIYTSHIAGITGMYHHTQLLLVEMGILKSFHTPVHLEPQPSLYLPPELLRLQVWGLVDFRSLFASSDINSQVLISLCHTYSDKLYFRFKLFQNI